MPGIDETKKFLNDNVQPTIANILGISDEGKLAKEQENKNGVLLFFKHSLHLELDTRILAMNCDIYGIEREHNSPEFELLQKTGRLKSMKGITDRKNTFTFIKWLKKGKTVLYAPDQDYGLKRSIEIDFFNKPAATISAPYKLINSTGCKAYFLNSYIILNIDPIYDILVRSSLIVLFYGICIHLFGFSREIKKILNINF